jgi:hypothetical protein
MSNLIGEYTPYRIAFKDISEYLKTQNQTSGNGDIWVVTPKQMRTKENIRLNKELGLHSINKYWLRKTK